MQARKLRRSFAMAQKRKTPLPKITDFLTTSSSRAERKSVQNPDGPSQSNRSKHLETFDPSWNDEFPWVRYLAHDQEDGPSMLCALCGKHNESSKRMVWLTILCKLFRKGKLREHGRSQCHADAVQAEAMAAARRSGGISASIEEQVSLQRQAVRGAFKCLYWLAKEETAHDTKFSFLLQLGKSLGCSYLSELEVSQTVRYTSHSMIDEFLTVLSDCVERDILSNVRASPALGILCDESTDVANLK